MSKQHLEAKRWLKSQRERYPFTAEAPAHIIVNDYFRAISISRVTAFNVITYAFGTEERRDEFLAYLEGPTG